jgi:tetratricopeptide (TPR) repeat protein
MRVAIQRQYFDEGLSATGVHTLVADHLAGLPAEDAIRQSELMFHRIGTQDRLRTARYYAGLARGGDELSGATRAAAEHILAGLSEQGNPRLDWMLSLLDEPALVAEEQGALCGRYHFELFDALENDAPLATRLAVVRRTNEVLQQLCRQAPGNAGWQHDLTASHDRMGDVLRAQGDLSAALSAYRASLAISERLAAADPGNAGWQRDLSVSQDNLGDVLSAQGDLSAALSTYRASLAIRERLAAADPGNAGWQRDLAVSHYKLAMFAREGQDQAGFVENLQRCFAVLDGMQRRGLHFDPQMAQVYQQLAGAFGGR